MSIFRVILGLSLCVLLVGGLIYKTHIDRLPPQMPGKVKDKILAYFSEHLRDPYSAKYTFDEWKVDDGSGRSVACGTVNSKNGFGGYTGKQLFIAVFESDGSFRFKFPIGELEAVGAEVVSLQRLMNCQT